MNAVEQKNVLIIYTDQLRRDVLGCYGGHEVLTPHIDSIAEEGLALDEFYTPSAVCTPSRGCFMTGRYPHANGAYRNGVPVGMQEHGFAEAFRLAGYQTGYIGKWHLADHKESGDLLGEYNPLGFEDWKDKVEFGHCKSVIRTQDGIRPERCVGDERTYTTDWLADEAVSFMEQRQKEKPFLLMVSIPDPHQPHEVRAPYDTMFDPKRMEIPESFYDREIPDWAERDTWGRNHYFPLGIFEREGHLARLKAQYLGSVKCIDDNVGKMLYYLKINGLWDNTIVIFTTDHGEYMGDHGLLEKNNLYESVYHLPLVMHLPCKAETGVRSSTYLDVVDFGVTLSGLAGIDYPFAVHGTDKSEDLLKGEAHYQRELYIHPSDVPRAGILTEDYELAYVGRGNTGEIFHDHVLFDMKKDPLQRRNLYQEEEYQAVVEELTRKMKEHHKKYRTPKRFLPREVWY